MGKTTPHPSPVLKETTYRLSFLLLLSVHRTIMGSQYAGMNPFFSERLMRGLRTYIILVIALVVFDVQPDQEEI